MPALEPAAAVAPTAGDGVRAVAAGGRHAAGAAAGQTALGIMRRGGAHSARHVSGSGWIHRSPRTLGTVAVRQSRLTAPKWPTTRMRGQSTLTRPTVPSHP